MILFGRRWNVATDDFVVSSLLASLSHLAWTAVTIYFYASCFSAPEAVCDGYDIRQAFGLSAICLHGMQSVLYAIFCFFSFRGTVFELSKRRNVPVMIGVLTAVTVLQFALSVWGSALHMQNTTTCIHHCITDAIVAMFLVSWVFTLLPFLTMLFAFDGVGHIDSDGYERAWHRRCRFLCCCIQDSASERDAFQSVSKTMTTIFRNTDLTPTDVAAGMVLMNLRQQEKSTQVAIVGIGCPPLPYQDVELVDLGLEEPSAERASSPSNTEPVTSAEIDRFMSYAKYYLGAYGSLLYLWNNIFTGSCRLMCRRKAFKFSAVGEGCCRFDSAALLAFTGLQDRDIIFANFGNKVCLPGFFIAAAAENEIVIGVRGTLSFQDCLTDAFAIPTLIKIEGCPGEACYVHSGMLRGARNVVAMMKAEGLLDALLLHRNIVILGHSLGAGVASILTILLREEHKMGSRVSCLAYAPPGGLLSRNLSEHTRKYIRAIARGQDMIPRLSVFTMNELRKRMIEALALSRRHKIYILRNCCVCTRRSAAYFFDDCVDDSTLDEAMMVAKDLLPETTESPTDAIMNMKMYPPVNFINLLPQSGQGKGKEQFRALRVDIEELQEILVTTAMVSDHMPDKLFEALQGCIFR